MSQVVPTHRTLDTGCCKVRLEPIGFARLPPRASGGRPHELFRVPLSVLRKQLEPAPGRLERDSEKGNAAKLATLGQFSLRPKADDHVRGRSHRSHVVQLKIPLLALSKASTKREQDAQPVAFRNFLARRDRLLLQLR